MSTYRALKGYNVKKVDSDPANPQIGQVWYNDTANQIKVRTQVTAAWASGGNLGTARYGLQGDGTQTAAFVAGGYPDLDQTEEYNGSSWSAGGNMGSNRYTFGANGTLTAGLAMGGYDPGTATATVNASRDSADDSVAA